MAVRWMAFEGIETSQQRSKATKVKDMSSPHRSQFAQLLMTKNIVYTLNKLTKLVSRQIEGIDCFNPTWIILCSFVDSL